MKLIALATVQHLIRLDLPLPFHVHGADGRLLLARGQRLEDGQQLATLLQRGALVDAGDALDVPDAPPAEPGRAALQRRWSQGLVAVSNALRHAPHPGFRQALDDAGRPILSLIEADPDLAIFQVTRRQEGAAADYGAQRSLNTAITAFLVAQRLGWDMPVLEKVFKIALTMNISMLGLQGELAHQRTPPSEAQRHALATHPMRSRRMLEESGIEDREWLEAVLRHHEVEDGSGYPSGRTDVGDLASLVRRADTYTAKLAARSHRDALTADVAGRQMFMEDPGHPMTAALVKEFGVYPPGCFVRLANGERGIVIERGAMVTTPFVASLTDEQGRARAVPLRRDSSEPPHAIVAIVGEREAAPGLTAEGLLRLTLR